MTTAETLKPLLDARVRKQLAMFATFGHIGTLIGEALAYIALAEEALAAAEEGRACSS